ncbi:MAG: NAD(P)/FAD-dependent oxidoreductase [Acidimicrobiales bacterium]
MRIAVVGAGVSGLVCARALARAHDVSVFEADTRPGGHSHTIRVDLADETHMLDTGFLVFNERNYPAFSALMGELGIASQPSDMSFSVSSPSFEYRGGTGPNGLFAQRANLLRPSFSRLISDIARLHRRLRILAGTQDYTCSVAEFLERHHFGGRLAAHYLVPLGSALWSADPARFLRFPALTVARFLDQHGMLDLFDKPRWRTITGGSVHYVERIVAGLGDRLNLGSPVSRVMREGGGVRLDFGKGGSADFDGVVMATHSDQSLRLLARPSALEASLLGDMHYQESSVVLHTDPSSLPLRRRAWASWNYRLIPGRAEATVTYLLNRLQGITSRHAFCVTLNRDDEIAPESVIRRLSYAHPIFDSPAIAAQRRLAELQGHASTWYCGAWFGYGFHEDGVRSALDVGRLLGVAG